MKTRTTLTMSLLLFALAGCCERPVPTMQQPQYPCNPYCLLSVKR